MQLLAKTNKLGEEDKIQALADLAELVKTTAENILARRSPGKEYVGGLRGTGEMIKDRMSLLDKDPMAVDRFHQFLTNGHVSDNPAQEDLKTSLSFQRKAYPNMRTLYERSRNRLFMSGRSDLARELDKYMLEYLESRNLGLTQKKAYSRDAEREVRNDLIGQVFGTLNDFEKAAVRGLLSSQEARERQVVDNLRGSLDKTKILREVYRHYSRDLYRQRQTEELAALNRVMARYVEVTTQSEETNPFAEYSSEQLRTKAQELAEYIQALSSESARPTHELQTGIVNQAAYWKQRAERQNALLSQAQNQLEQVLEVLDLEADIPDEE